MPRTLYEKKGEEFVEVEGFIQEDVDEIVTKRLERQSAKHTKDMEEFESLKKFKDEHETALAELKQKNEDLSSQLDKAQQKANRSDIMREFKLDSDLSEFITGTVEEMRARAEKLSKTRVSGAAVVNKEDTPDPVKSDTAAVAEALFGNPTD